MGVMAFIVNDTEPVTIVATGDDEAEALDAIVELLG